MLELFIYVSVTKSFYRKKMKTDEDSKIPQKIEKADFIPTQNSCGFMMSKLNEIQTMAVEHAIKNDGAFVDIGCAYGIAALEGMIQIFDIILYFKCCDKIFQILC